MGGPVRFVNHSCKPKAEFVEVANGRCTTVVVVTTEEIHRGEEVTVDYGDDLCSRREGDLASEKVEDVKDKLVFV
ncbi:hypothetical protein PI125_g18329 [Phytophthora idaei]|nr:hypothetical protein PI125_g18329 [Phytophthora idaei]